MARLCNRAIFVFSLLAYAKCASAQTPEVLRASETPNLSEIAQRFVDGRLAVWQERLKLQDWKVSAVLTPQNALAPRTLGGIHWEKRKKSAVIWVLDPADYALPLHAMLDDMELTIVHELVHLELTALPRGQANRGMAEERAVSGLADAMIALDRQERHSPK